MYLVRHNLHGPLRGLGYKPLFYEGGGIDDLGPGNAGYYGNKIVAGRSRTVTPIKTPIKTPTLTAPKTPIACPQIAIDHAACIAKGGTIVAGPAPCYTPSCRPGRVAVPVTRIRATPTPGSSPTQTATPTQQLQQMLNTNPTLMTAAQWAAAQEAGLIPSTLPQSDAGLLTPSGAAASVNDLQCLAMGLFGGPYPNCVSADPQCTAAGETGGPYPSCSPAGAVVNDPQCVAAGMTGGPYPNCTPAASSLLGGISWTDPTTYPWWLWLGILGGSYFMFSRKKKGRR